MVHEQHEPTGKLTMTWWMEDGYQYFVRNDGEKWDSEYIRKVTTTPPEKYQKMKEDIGNAILKWWMQGRQGRYLLFTLDFGQTWEDKKEDIEETIRRYWKR